MYSRSPKGFHPPIALNLDAFRTDPLVNALFVSSKDANEFDIHELTWIGNTRNMVLQIAYAR